MSDFIKYVRPITVNRAEGLVAQTYRQIKREMAGVPEPFLIHSPVAPLLAGVWSIFRESLVAGRARRGLKEMVATKISQINQCPWCVDAHSLVLHATGDQAAIRVLANHEGRVQLSSEARAIIRWAAATRQPGAASLMHPPFSDQDAPEFIGTVVTFHYLNRMVNVLLTETPLPMAPWLKGATTRMLGFMFMPWVRRDYSGGASLSLLPEAELPADFGWAKGNVTVAAALARFAAVVEQAGATALSPAVRELVRDHIQNWTGADPGLSRSWVDEAVRGHDEGTQAAARLALLAALASHQVDEQVVVAFRAYYPGDETLVAALAWACFAAARRIGSWLGNPVMTAR